MFACLIHKNAAKLNPRFETHNNIPCPAPYNDIRQDTLLFYSKILKIKLYLVTWCMIQYELRWVVVKKKTGTEWLSFINEVCSIELMLTVESNIVLMEHSWIVSYLLSLWSLETALLCFLKTLTNNYFQKLYHNKRSWPNG